MVLNGHYIRWALIIALLGGVLGCQPDAAEPLSTDTFPAQTLTALSRGEENPLPPLETYADTVAMRVFEASGGPAAWQALRYLRFNFSVMRQHERGRVIRHFWDRQTGAYRLELPGPANEPYVVLFNVNTREGAAYWQSSRLEEVENAKQLEEAYHRFINDTYWLLAPFKLFDPGVNRTYVPDSSDASYDVIRLTFGDVGLTPGDQYWLYADKETGRLARWSYVLESSEPGAPPRSFVWVDYEEHGTPAGSLFFATLKRGFGVPFAIRTNEISTPSPSQVADDMLTATAPRLNPVDPEEDASEEGAPPQPNRPKDFKN